LQLTLEEIKREPIISPVPLPPGVECIDPVDDSFLEYWSDFIKYLKIKELDHVFSAETICGSKRDLPGMRSRLMNWLLELALHYNVCQETLYHTVRLVDTVLALRDVRRENLQLLGLTAFLIAAKLEEYYAPSIESLLLLTENSYTAQEVFKMEQRVLKVVDGRTYGPEPMVFLNRYIRAAFIEEEKKFTNVCQLFIDSLIAHVEYSSMTHSIKAAAAVFAGKVIFGSEFEEAWTPTLRYYTGYALSEVAPLAAKMVRLLARIIEKMQSSKVKQEIVKKFSSNSRHGAIIKYLYAMQTRVVDRSEKLTLFADSLSQNPC
jgi:hypothetical protein